ncbi:MAG: SGNH/GDSL hydrolase family protein [Lentisphaeria bacterium]|nr:SGNH/GDSL hydrolase family protein [Lentisphaeria bacterium]
MRMPIRPQIASLATLAVAVCLGAEPEATKPKVAPVAAPPPIKLLLPPVIYAVPGVEMNVYFDNVSLTVNPANYVFDVTCNRGIQQNERWSYTPTGKTIGQFGFSIAVRNRANELLTEAKSMIRVSPKNAGAGRPVSILVIGDSLTAASVYPKHVGELCQGEDNPKLKMIGSVRRTSGYPHEGYGGWTAQRFATLWKDGVARTGAKTGGSPFLYAGADGKPALDLGKYCEEFNGGKAPDFVTILLGCNDTFSATDETIEARIDIMFQHYDTLLEMIRSLSKDTQIGCLLLVPPAGTQDAFGANYRCSQTRWQYKRNQFRVAERMMAHYGGREKENINLIPANVNLDCMHNYPSRTGKANSRSERKVTRLANGVHPAAEGYRQIGDSIYCWLKACLAAKE